MSEISTRSALALNLQVAANLLSSAFEGGSNYWYSITGYQAPDSLEFLSDAAHAAVMGRRPEIYKHIDYPLNEGGQVQLVDLENNEKPHVLDLEACARGWQVMHDQHPKQWALAVSDEGDAETADIYLQCCIFGEVIYG